MSFDFDVSDRDDISELYELNPNTLEVWLMWPGNDFRVFRITAKRSIPDGRYWANFEEMVEMQIGLFERKVWVEAEFPWADGANVEECLGVALSMLTWEDQGDR